MYLLDANIYLNFYDRYYKVQFFPSFWNKLPSILNSKVIIPDVVISENYQSSFLSEWLKQNYLKEIINHKDYVADWGSVLNYISESDVYSDGALMGDKGWAHERIADPWIIAIAKAENLTVVTSETSNVSLNSKNPSKNPKIPDVCKELEVRCIDMNTFFEEVNLMI
ncbi:MULTISPECIES: DUF4411 family protein [Streptococcus]|uniref:DUF4411 family protein n=1 Tax=Streptococcus caledonicus TaxID=2614158 RepID=A0ABW0UCF3_9STRE|nr:DUF4411 family protein [Streptococcus sp. S784/96/1]